MIARLNSDHTRSTALNGTAVFTLGVIDTLVLPDTSPIPCTREHRLCRRLHPAPSRPELDEAGRSDTSWLTAGNYFQPHVPAARNGPDDHSLVMSIAPSDAAPLAARMGLVPFPNPVEPESG